MSKQESAGVHQQEPCPPESRWNWNFCPGCGRRDSNSTAHGGGVACWHCGECGFIECDNLVFNHAEAWRIAATLKDRTRREIRRRVRAGEAIDSIAQDFEVPVPFVQLLAAWEMAQDE
jgi:hypothetical protein